MQIYTNIQIFFKRKEKKEEERKYVLSTKLFDGECNILMNNARPPAKIKDEQSSIFIYFFFFLNFGTVTFSEFFQNQNFVYPWLQCSSLIERKQAEMDRQKALADAKARQADEARAKAEKAKQQQADKDKEAQQAQNNSPVSFSAGQASWRRQPSFSCHSEDLENGALTATIRYTVDKQGNPTSVTLAKSTGNARVDRQLSMQAKSGKFNPFTKNGVPVVGIVNLPVRCQ